MSATVKDWPRSVEALYSGKYSGANDSSMEIVSGKRDLAHTSSTRYRNVTLALKCVANIKFRALQLHSGSQCVRTDGHFRLLRKSKFEILKKKNTILAELSQILFRRCDAKCL